MTNRINEIMNSGTKEDLISLLIKICNGCGVLPDITDFRKQTKLQLARKIYFVEGGNWK